MKCSPILYLIHELTIIEVNMEEFGLRIFRGENYFKMNLRDLVRDCWTFLPITAETISILETLDAHFNHYVIVLHLSRVLVNNERDYVV